MIFTSINISRNRRNFKKSIEQPEINKAYPKQTVQHSDYKDYNLLKEIIVKFDEQKEFKLLSNTIDDLLKEARKVGVPENFIDIIFKQ